MNALPRCCALLVTLLLSSRLGAEVGFYVGAVRDLTFQGKAPEAAAFNRLLYRTNRDAVHVDHGEAMLFHANPFHGNRKRRVPWSEAYEGPTLAVRGESGATVNGMLVIDDGKGAATHYRFKVRLTPGDDNRRKAFWTPWRDHYSLMASRDQPGTAWYRHQVARADRALGSGSGHYNWRYFGGRWIDTTSGESTMALLSGGRAVSEHLNLSLEIPMAGADGEEGKSVPLTSIRGIGTRKFQPPPTDDRPSPQLDALARVIPSDQHAVFLPSFRAMVQLADEADKHGTPLLLMAEPRAEDAGVRSRYERQLGLSLNSAARLIGPRLIAGLAITGGDTYLRTGSDLALLMKSGQPKTLQGFIEAQRALVAGPAKAARVQGDVEGVAYTGYRTPNREVCSYLAQVGDAVVVTNSLAQLRRIVAASSKQAQSLAETPEFVYFRSRYRLGDEAETALVVLSEATIRRWCSPRWRIAASRRTRVAAAMAEIQARHLNDVVRGGQPVRTVSSEFGVARGEPLLLAEGRISSQVYGDFGFQTPINELQLTRASLAEARLYRTWRDGFQRSWNDVFDPTAVRLEIRDDWLSADATVLPLAQQGRFQELADLSKGAQLDGDIGDPHAEALVQWRLALNPDASTLKRYADEFATDTLRQLRVDPLSWIGRAVSVYVDADPLLQQAAKEKNPPNFLEQRIDEVPVAFHADVRDGLKLAAFMAGLRATVEGVAPNMTTWESQKHQGEPYVKILVRGILPREVEIFYAASGEGLTVTPNESVIRRVLERRVARRQADGKQPPQHGARWKGQQVSLKFKDGPLLRTVFSSRSRYQGQLQRLSHANLPILNEWKRKFPDLDPVEVHQKLWQRRLYCPGGGKYVWNEQLRTMESTVYGSPLAKKWGGPRFLESLEQFTTGELGMAFDDEGLRARIVLEHKGDIDR